MAKQDLKEPEEIKEPEFQVQASESEVVKTEPKPAKKETGLPSLDGCPISLLSETVGS